MSELIVPTEKEIAQLPRWAQVAFAARCARRVLPLFKAGCPDASEKHVSAVERAVDIASQAASQAHVASQTAAWDAAMVASQAQAIAASQAQAKAAAMVAVLAATASASQAASQALPQAVARAASQAHVATLTAAASGSWIREDFDLLAQTARAEQWTDNTPVPPEFFGPLWPDGPPPGWPTEKDGAAKISELSVRPDTSRISPQIEVYFQADELTPEEIELFLEYLDAVYHEKAGGRLMVVEPRAMEPEEAEVPA